MIQEDKQLVLRKKVERLICVAAGGSISEGDLHGAKGVLADVGLSSIGYMNLFESLERSFGIVIDPEKDPQYLASIDTIVTFVSEQLDER